MNKISVLRCTKKDNLFHPSDIVYLLEHRMDLIERITWRLPYSTSKKNKLIIDSEAILNIFMPQLDKSMTALVHIEDIAKETLINIKRTRAIFKYLEMIKIARYSPGTVQLLDGPNMLAIPQIIQDVVQAKVI